MNFLYYLGKRVAVTKSCANEYVPIPVAVLYVGRMCGELHHVGALFIKKKSENFQNE